MSWQLGLGWWDGTTQKWMILGPILEEELVRFADELNVQYGESSFQQEQLEGHSCCHLLNCKCF